MSDNTSVFKTRVFIPSQTEMELISFLNMLPREGYDFIPDHNQLILDLMILKEMKSELSDELEIEYQSVIYRIKDFIDLFDKEEKVFYPSFDEPEKLFL